MSPQLDVQQDGNRHDVGRQGADTIAHERQRYTRDGHNAHRHTHVDEDVEGNHRGDADREQPSEGIARILGNPYPAPENDEIEEEQNRAANEAEFLAHNGEDKVRMVLGQEVQLTLCAAEKPLAKEHARANRNLRLDDVIARAERIDVRIHKHHDAHFLVILEKMPKHRHRCKSRGEDAKEKAQSYPRRKDHAEEDR